MVILLVFNIGTHCWKGKYEQSDVVVPLFH